MPHGSSISVDMRYVRKEKLHLTQEKAAELLYISVNEYKNVEAGRYWPKVPLFFRITQLFGLDPRDYAEEAAKYGLVHSD